MSLHRTLTDRQMREGSQSPERALIIKERANQEQERRTHQEVLDRVNSVVLHLQSLLYGIWYFTEYQGFLLYRTMYSQSSAFTEFDNLGAFYFTDVAADLHATLTSASWPADPDGFVPMRFSTYVFCLSLPDFY